MIQLYAVTDHPGPPLPDVPRLTVVARGAIAAICGQAPDGDETSDMLWRHERVVETLTLDRDVLPLRYGTSVPDAAAAGRLLETNHEHLLRSLEFVRDATEVSVRVLNANGNSGRSRSRASARAIVAKAEVAQAVHERLSVLAQAETLRPVLPGEMLRGAYLVKQNAVERFSAVLRQLQLAYPAWQITFTRPGPPYSFASLGADQTGAAAGR